ncbi:unnamed protein product [Allacma fusca]|uniref:Uncharacterized protein n=1 Tax=Allacma fusca TaxID=39272 RepID=A0A8J2LH82_9HEXA|nr:unnamed protein product [Allacma fusca]
MSRPPHSPIQPNIKYSKIFQRLDKFGRKSTGNESTDLAPVRNNFYELSEHPWTQFGIDLTDNNTRLKD